MTLDHKNKFRHLACLRFRINLSDISLNSVAVPGLHCVKLLRYHRNVYSYVIYTYTSLRLLQHSSSFTYRASLCIKPSVCHRHPPTSTSTVPSSHDHFTVVHRPQVLIIKASPDAPPHSIRPSVRLIPQI